MYDKEISIRKGARLSHWSKEGAMYAVTFRLADSLPRDVREEIEKEREVLKAKTLRPNEISRAKEVFSRKMDQYLDAGKGECWLERPEIAECVSDAIRILRW